MTCCDHETGARSERVGTERSVASANIMAVLPGVLSLEDDIRVGTTTRCLPRIQDSIVCWPGMLHAIFPWMVIRLNTEMLIKVIEKIR
jgi:hypothetical protein